MEIISNLGRDLADSSSAEQFQETAQETLEKAQQISFREHVQLAIDYISYNYRLLDDLRDSSHVPLYSLNHKTADKAQDSPPAKGTHIFPVL